MNSRLFRIGMFPYVCLATMPLFCYPEWPKKIFSKTKSFEEPETTDVCLYSNTDNNKFSKSQVGWRHRLTCALLLSHVALQGFLPYSHFITQGYNNWTNGLYGYSWDMMVHSWETILVVVKVVDKDTGEDHFLDPQAWTHTERYSKHADMLIQYVHCLKKNIQREYPAIKNLSIHIDAWNSLNRRFQQRMFDPRVDLLTADWSPFKPVGWLMPLLTELTPWREKFSEIEEQVYSWSNSTDALFVADFPGLHLENYIHEDLSNVSLTVLDGAVLVEMEDGTNLTVDPGESMQIPTKTFHKVHTVSLTPSCYMYTYTNSTLLNSDSQKVNNAVNQNSLAFLHEMKTRWYNFKHAVDLVSNSLLKVIYSIPMIKGVNHY